MRAGLARLGPARIRSAQRGLTRPAPHTPWPAGSRAGPFFFFFMIKLSMFKN